MHHLRWLGVIWDNINMQICICNINEDRNPSIHNTATVMISRWMSMRVIGMIILLVIPMVNIIFATIPSSPPAIQTTRPSGGVSTWHVRLWIFSIGSSLIPQWDSSSAFSSQVRFSHLILYILGSEPLPVVFLPSDCHIIGLCSFAQPLREFTDCLALLSMPKLFGVIFFPLLAKHFCFISQLLLLLEISPLGFLSLFLFFPKTWPRGETRVVFVLRFICFSDWHVQVAHCLSNILIRHFWVKAEHECTCGWPGSVPTGISN